MRYVLFVFGILAVIFGVAIYGWVLYNMFFPTKEFKENAGASVGQYIFPGLMIAFGIKWVLGIRKPTDSNKLNDPANPVADRNI